MFFIMNEIIFSYELCLPYLTLIQLIKPIDLILFVSIILQCQGNLIFF